MKRKSRSGLGTVVVLGVGLTIGVYLTAPASGEVDAHAVAARRALSALKVDANFEQLMVSSMDMQVQANPQLAPYREVMVRWAKEQLTWAEIEPDFIVLYKKYFTEDELNTLADFYETPTGSKSVDVMPALFEEGGRIGMQLGQKKGAILQEMIQQEQQRNGQ